MKNTYKIQVKAQCPVNPSDTDLYHFSIESDNLIPVEKIVTFFNKHAGNKKTYQERLTHMAAVSLGAKVTSVGVHSNVLVECVCP
jgi:hypothetical protein